MKSYCIEKGSLELSLLKRAIAYSLDEKIFYKNSQELYDTWFPKELVNKIKDFSNEERFEISNIIMNKLVDIVKYQYGIEFDNFASTQFLDVLWWVNKVIKTFHIHSLKDFELPRIYTVTKDGTIFFNKFLKHNKLNIVSFDSIIPWYNLSKVFNEKYWLKLKLSDNTEVIGFRSYVTNDINGLLNEAYYSVTDFLNNPFNTAIIPNTLIIEKQIYQG